MRIAVTGSGGHLGGEFVRAAEARGYNIRHLVRNPERSGQEDDRKQFDLFDPHVDPRILDGCDAVVHLAAHIPVDHDDPADVERCWRANALGSRRLAEAAAIAGIGWFAQTTAGNAYAAGLDRPTETSALFPSSRVAYLASKVAQEFLVEDISMRTRFPVATLRVSSIYGPHQKSGVFAYLARRLGRGDPVRLSDGGRYGADFVHVRDVAAALLLLLDRQAALTVNVGSGVRTTVASLANRIRLLSRAVDARIDIEPYREPGLPGFPALSIDRIAALGYEPTPLDHGIEEMLVAMTEHRA